MLRKLALVLLVTLLLIPGSGNANPVMEPVPVWFNLPPVAPMYYPISMFIWNTTQRNIQISDTSPWDIVEADMSTLVYSPGVALCWAVELPPGFFWPGQWGQRNNAGQQVPPGDYYSRINWWFVEEPSESYTSYAWMRILGDIAWLVDNSPVEVGGQLTLTLDNRSESTYQLANEAPWRITDMTGATVYEPPLTPMPVDLPPGGSLEWILPIDASGANLSPGDYQVEIDVVDQLSGFARKFRRLISIIPAVGEVVWTVTPVVNGTKSVVMLTVNNLTTQNVVMSDYGPWHIENDLGENIFTPIACQAFWSLPPGGSMSWPWHEVDDAGQYVPGGTYTAVFGYTLDSDKDRSREQERFSFELIDPDGVAGCVFVETDDHEYDEGETVSLTYTNCVLTRVGMRATQFWWIANEFGMPVYCPVAGWALTYWEHEEGFSSSWDQMDMRGDRVQPGTYYVMVAFSDDLFLTNWVVSSAPFVLTGGGTEVAEAPAPVAYLGQNYPNPFNPGTVITYSLKEEGHVRLRIIDANGRVIRTLVDEMKAESSRYEIIWDGRDDNDLEMPNGVYFSRLEFKNSSESRKLVLLK
ncbi:MAG: T9SS type A sorting domain-containing protein [bacterium]|nr:T9SS type A sorting domain-containing protein [bacterium]